MTWHLLQISDVLDIEFGSALAERVPLIAWEPERVNFPTLRASATQRRVLNPPLEINSFPLLRGYARLPWSALAFTGFTVSRQLLKRTSDPQHSPLICTTPYLAPVAEAWHGPVVYWLTDRMERYDGANPTTVHRLDQRMCRAASLVCPNSSRLAEYLMENGGCSPDKIRILPNATRASNLLPYPQASPGPLPGDIADVPRPIAGVIGNLAGNMDWLFLQEFIQKSGDVQWVFVGPTDTAIDDAVQSNARSCVMEMPSTRFVGRKPYGDLAAYARAFNVAVLPYRRCEPTYSGSSTRFYEHLAACRPMIATRGFEELLRKEPMLRLVDTAAEAVAALKELAAKGFSDGFETLRWTESQSGTWQVRASTLIDEVEALPAALRRAQGKSSLAPQPSATCSPQ